MSSVASEVKRILFVAPYVPSPIRVRPYQIIRHLARQGHRITLAALEDTFATPQALEELRRVCEAVHIVPHGKARAALQCLLALPTSTPLWAAYCQSPEMEALLHRLTQEGQFDVAHVEHLRAAHFAPALGNLPRLIDAVDCITELRKQMTEQGQGFSRMLSQREWGRLRVYEPKAYRHFARIAVTSAYDASALIALDPMHLPPVEVVPNGVDLEYFSPEASAKNITIEPSTLIFTGKLSYSANRDAACFLIEDIFPRILASCPEAQLIIGGSSPGRDLIRRAARIGGVTVTGYVEDLRPYLRRAAVAVCPMRIGVGIQNKALEAMAMACPVVCTPLVARALGPAVAVGALQVAEGADALAAACTEFLRRPQAARTAGQMAREYVEKYHHWQIAAAMFSRYYDLVITR